jgi:hypothetical protein
MDTVMATGQHAVQPMVTKAVIITHITKNTIQTTTTSIIRAGHTLRSIIPLYIANGLIPERPYGTGILVSTKRATWAGRISRNIAPALTSKPALVDIVPVSTPRPVLVEAAPLSEPEAVPVEAGPGDSALTRRVNCYWLFVIRST